MKRAIAVCWGMTGSALLGFAFVAESSAIEARAEESVTETKPSREEYVERGRYLVKAMACTHCHTPHDDRGGEVPGLYMSGHPENAPLPQWDPSLLERGILVGLAPTLTAFAGPFGVSVAGNLTPDEETGIGTLTLEQFIESRRTGLHWRLNRPVMPPMPDYREVSDEDLKAIYTFMMSLPPVHNRFPDSVPAGHGTASASD